MPMHSLLTLSTPSIHVSSDKSCFFEQPSPKNLLCIQRSTLEYTVTFHHVSASIFSSKVWGNTTEVMLGPCSQEPDSGRSSTRVNPWFSPSCCAPNSTTECRVVVYVAGTASGTATSSPLDPWFTVMASSICHRSSFLRFWISYSSPIAYIMT